MTDNLDFSPGGADGPPEPKPLVVRTVMEGAQACIEEMLEREEMLDERLHNVFLMVHLLTVSINTMMSRKQLNTPIPALGMRTTAELFNG